MAWTLIIDGLWIGDLENTPQRQEYDCVVTVHDQALTVEDGIAHLHVKSTSYPDIDVVQRWLVPRFMADKRCLIRSASVAEAALVALDVLVEMGAAAGDAVGILARIMRLSGERA